MYENYIKKILLRVSSIEARDPFSYGTYLK